MGGGAISVKPKRPEESFCISPMKNARAMATTFADASALVDKILGFAFISITITGMLLKAYGGSSIAISRMNLVVVVYAGARAAIGVLAVAKVLFNLKDNGTDLVKDSYGVYEDYKARKADKVPKVQADENEQDKTPPASPMAGKERAIRVVYGLTSTSQEALNVIRTSLSPVLMLVAALAGTQLSGTTAIVGMFPAVTLAKHSIALFEYTFDRATGAKKLVKGTEDPHEGTTAIRGLAAMGEVVLAIAKVCGATLPMWPMIATMATVSTIQLWEQLKKWDENAEKAKADKAAEKSRKELAKKALTEYSQVERLPMSEQEAAVEQKYQQELKKFQEDYIKAQSEKDAILLQGFQERKQDLALKRQEANTTILSALHAAK